MDLLNQKVMHKTLGTGTIIAQDEKYISVSFDTKTSKFAYPDAFEKYIVADDQEVQDGIKSELAARAEAKEEAKRKEEEERKEAEERQFAKLAQRANRSVPKNAKSLNRVQRVEGNPMTFFVFQGSTFEAEYRGGYLWAPKYNAAGNSFHHWDRLLDVREGDIILHCADGYIQAVSLAKGPCYDAESPAAIKAEQMWQNEGRRIDCEYMKIKSPLKTADYKDKILEYCNVKYAPFDKDGNGNMGYLFEINPELAKFFIDALTVKNGYLLDLEYIQEFLK